MRLFCINFALFFFCFLKGENRTVRHMTSVNIFDRGAATEATVWDDSELIAAWNAQLQRIQTEKGRPITVPVGGSDDHDDTTSSEEADSNVGSSAESSTSSGPRVALDVQHVPLVGAKRQRQDNEGDAAPGQNLMMMPPMPLGVGPEVEGMLRAWFTAGFETGKFIASAAGKQRNRREN